MIPIDHFKHLSDADLLLELEYCRTTDRQQRDKKGRAAEQIKKTNADRFTAVMRELKKRGVSYE